MSGQKNQNEDMMMICAIALILGGLCFGVWYLFRVQLTDLVRWVRWCELWIDKLIVGDDYAINTDAGRMTVKQWRAWLRVAQAREITTDHLGMMTTIAVPPLRRVFAVLIGLMGILTLFFGHGSHYRRRLGLETLMREQSASFPAIQPFVKFDPRKQPFRAPGMPVPSQLPLFSEALSPEEWVAYNEIPVANGQVDYGKAWQALAKQLGRRWEGPLKLSIHAQGIYAACALKHVRKRKECEAMLNAMALSWTPERGFRPPRFLRSMIRKTIKDPKIGGILQAHADQHAWETTALLRCLSRARSEGGVLAPAEFLWLRGHDRALWYPLNNMGRKSYHAEAAGAMVHYTNELIAGQKIPTPRLEDVVRGIETYLKSPAAREIPELDKKAGGRK